MHALRDVAHSLSARYWYCDHVSETLKMAHNTCSRYRDIPFEVKKILSDIPRMHLEDEVVIVPPLGSKMMTAAQLYECHCPPP